MGNSVAIVTGAGRGVGRAAAHALARDGYLVALVARTQDHLDVTKQEAGDAIVLPADIANPDEVDRVVASTVHRFERLDAIVHCAGVAPIIPIERTTNSELRTVLDTNLSS